MKFKLKKTAVLLAIILLLVLEIGLNAASLSPFYILNKCIMCQKSASYSADVSINVRTGKKENIQKGKLTYISPEKYYIELSTPKKLLISFDNKQLTTKDPVSGNKIIQDISNLSEKDLLSLPVLPDISSFQENFSFKKTTSSNSTYTLDGISKKPDSMVKKIDLSVDKTYFLPNRIVYYGKNGSLVGLNEIRYGVAGDVLLPTKFFSMTVLSSGSTQAFVEYSNVKRIEEKDVKDFPTL